MAKVPKGPGQAEVIGDINNPQTPNNPGQYRDPESGAELEVTMNAGADALVRMGWERVGDNTISRPQASRKPQTDFDPSDVFSISKASSGEKRYFKNGKRISAKEYEKSAPA